MRTQHERAMKTVLVFITSIIMAAESVHFYKATQPLSVNITAIGEIDNRGLIQCASECLLQYECKFFSWSQPNPTCTLYRKSSTSGIRSVPGNLYIPQGNASCPANMARDKRDICMCANGRIGASCDTEFSYELTERQIFNLVPVFGGDHLEIDGVSYLFFVSVNPNISIECSVSIYSRNASLSSQYELKQVIHTGTVARGMTTFQHAGNGYFLIGSSYTIPWSPSVPQTLYKYNSTSQRFSEVSRQYVNNVVQPNSYHHSNGDIYACYGSYASDNVLISKFNSNSEAFYQTYNISLAGNHFACSFMEIGDHLYIFVATNAVATSPSNIYRMNADETWSFYQTIPLTPSSDMYGLDIIKTEDSILLAGGFISGNTTIYRWNDTFFTLTQIIQHGYSSCYIKFVETAGQIFLMIDDILLGQSSFPVYKLNYDTGLFELYRSISADGPMGFFQYSYMNELFLVCLNYLDVGSTVYSSDKNQQLFQWS